MGRGGPMVLRGNSNQGLLRWFELTGNEAFQASGPATRSPECKEHLQNRSSVGGLQNGIGSLRQAISPTNRRARNFVDGKGLVGPPGLEPGTNRL
jgi:hypothetical protein